MLRSVLVEGCQKFNPLGKQYFDWIIKTGVLGKRHLRFFWKRSKQFFLWNIAVNFSLCGIMLC